MSLTKLLLAPIKLFRKQVITFLIVRRYDLGTFHENLSYIAVKPSASIFVLRQKVWHLLNLPDYCEEIIILKSPGDKEIALTELRKGNNPQHPYILEVWLPGSREEKKPLDTTTTVFNNMLTYTKNEDRSINFSTSSMFEKKESDCAAQSSNVSQSELSNATKAINNKHHNNYLLSDFKKSDLSCKISRSSLFRCNGKKSQDNFTNLLLKIQGDLSTLSNKLSVLENKMTLSSNRESETYSSVLPSLTTSSLNVW